MKLIRHGNDQTSSFFLSSHVEANAHAYIFRSVYTYIYIYATKTCEMNSREIRSWLCSGGRKCTVTVVRGGKYDVCNAQL